MEPRIAAFLAGGSPALKPEARSAPSESRCAVIAQLREAASLLIQARQYGELVDDTMFKIGELCRLIEVVAKLISLVESVSEV